MDCNRDLTEMAIKAVTSAGGFLGGTSMMVYMKPFNWQDAVRRVVVSTITAAMLSVPIANKLFDVVGSEVLMGVGFVIGFIAWNALGAVALFFENNKDKDIVQLSKKVKDGLPDLD